MKNPLMKPLTPSFRARLIGSTAQSVRPWYKPYHRLCGEEDLSVFTEYTKIGGLKDTYRYAGLASRWEARDVRPGPDTVVAVLYGDRPEDLGDPVADDKRDL